MEGSVLDRQDPVGDVQGQQIEPAKSRGCFFWGCITAVILVVLFGVGSGIAAYKMLNYARSFTSDTPAEIPVYQPAEGEYEAVKVKVKNFKDAVEGGTSGVELVLTGNDINAIIASDEDLAEVKGKAYVQIEDDKITMDASIPLDEIPGFSGRYLNGSAAVTASMKAGILFVGLEHIEVNGNALPEEIMEQMRNENLAKGLYEDKEKMELLDKVQDLRVEGDKLILISK